MVARARALLTRHPVKRGVCPWRSLRASMHDRFRDCAVVSTDRTRSAAHGFITGPACLRDSSGAGPPGGARSALSRAQSSALAFTASQASIQSLYTSIASLSAVICVSYFALHVLHCTVPSSVSKLLRAAQRRHGACHRQATRGGGATREPSACARGGSCSRLPGRARGATHSLALTLFSWLQKGHVNSLSSLGATFFGGGLLDLRLPCGRHKAALQVWRTARRRWSVSPCTAPSLAHTRSHHRAEPDRRGKLATAATRRALTSARTSQPSAARPQCGAPCSRGARGGAVLPCSASARHSRNRNAVWRSARVCAPLSAPRGQHEASLVRA